MENKVNEMISRNLPVTYLDNNHITIDGRNHFCTGPRIHVSNTGQIENFHLLHHFIYDRFSRRYLLVGCVGENAETNLKAVVVLPEQVGPERVTTRHFSAIIMFAASAS